MSANRSVPVRGVFGGLLAATAIVLFFLVLDLTRGEPLRTPALLVGVLVGREAAAVGPGLLVLYTALHYAVFAVVGAAAGWVLARLRAPATILLGLVLGLLLFDVLFYASVAVRGVDVVRALGWPSVLAGNLVGGVVLAVYLARSGVARGRSWREAWTEHPVVRQGVVAGVLGALAVAGWFFVLDLLRGRLLYTPAALGAVLFEGAGSPGGVTVATGPVLGYTVVHFLGFLVVGLVFAALVARAEKSPPLLMGLVLLFVTFETLVLGLVAILAAWLLEVVSWWSIALGNVLAAVVMAGYLWRAHPRLRAEVDRSDDEGLEAQAGRDPVSRTPGAP